MDAFSFLLRLERFQKVIGLQVNKQEVIKIAHLVTKNEGIVPRVSSLLSRSLTYIMANCQFSWPSFCFNDSQLLFLQVV